MNNNMIIFIYLKYHLSIKGIILAFAKALSGYIIEIYRAHRIYPHCIKQASRKSLNF